MEEFYNIASQNINTIDAKNINKLYQTRKQVQISILMYASFVGNLPAMHLLLQKGANPNLKNEYDQTALMWAVMGRQLGAVKLLIKHDANPIEKNKKGMNILKYALGTKNELSNFGKNRINIKTRSKKTNVVKAIVNNVPQLINAQDNNGATPLMYSLAKTIKSKGEELFNFEIVNYLLEKGANPLIENINEKNFISLLGTAYKLLSDKIKIDIETIKIQISDFIKSIETGNNTHGVSELKELKNELNLLIPPGSLENRLEVEKELKKLTLQRATSAGGNKKKYIYNGKKYVVRTGPRGGQYILVKNKKVYL